MHPRKSAYRTAQPSALSQASERLSRHPNSPLSLGELKIFKKIKKRKSAATAAGIPGLVPHDMRRSAVRNFRRAGLSEHEGMKLSGHETDSIYRRYDIISDDDLTESMNRVQEHLKKEAENRKVVPLKRETA